MRDWAAATPIYNNGYGRFLTSISIVNEDELQALPERAS
jgi:hypothetical protein